MLIDALRGTPSPEALAFRRLAARETIVLGDVVLLEALRGVPTEAGARRLAERLAQFRQVAMLSPALAEQGAAQYRRLRGLGLTPRRLADGIIAAWCIAERVPLLARDRDFAGYAMHCGLRLQPLDAPSPAPDPG